MDGGGEAAERAARLAASVAEAVNNNAVPMRQTGAIGGGERGRFSVSAVLSQILSTSAMASITEVTVPVGRAVDLVAVLRMCADALEDGAGGAGDVADSGLTFRSPLVGRVLHGDDNPGDVDGQGDRDQGGAIVITGDKVLSSPVEFEVVGAPAEPIPSTWVTAERVAPHGTLVRVRTTAPSGAAVVIVLPEKLPAAAAVTGCDAIIHLHGYREPGRDLVAEDLDDPLPLVFDTMAGQGMVVASTSYRRTGRCVRDGVADAVEARALVAELLAAHGVHLKRVFIEGRSMGGAVATYTIETHPELFAGAVCIGAALLVKDDPPHEPMTFTHMPTVPLLFLTNCSELSYVEQYIARVQELQQAGGDGTENICVPALWTVYREGHNAVSARERLGAAKALVNWADHGTFITGRALNVFIAGEGPRGYPPPRCFDLGGTARLEVAVVAIHPIFKSFELGCTLDDLRELLGVLVGRRFQLIPGGRLGNQQGPSTSEAEPTHAAEAVNVIVSSYPHAGIEAGQYIAFETPDGSLVVSIFGWYSAASAAEALAVTVGDRVILESI